MFQNGFIRRLHVGVRSDDGGDQSVQIVAGGDFFTGGFRVHVHKDDLHAFFLPESFGFRFRDEEGVFKRRLDEGTSLHLHDGYFSPGRFHHHASVSRCPLRVVDGAQHARFGVQPRSQFRLVPYMVPRRDDVHSRMQQFLRQTGRNAAPCGRVFTVDDDKVRPMLLFEFRQHVLHGGAARFADHIAYKEYGNHEVGRDWCGWRFLLLFLGDGNHQHGHGGFPHDGAGYAAQKDGGKEAVVVLAHHDHVNVVFFSIVDDRFADFKFVFHSLDDGCVRQPGEFFRRFLQMVFAMEMTSFSSVWSITGTGTSSGSTPETS